MLCSELVGCIRLALKQNEEETQPVAFGAVGKVKVAVVFHRKPSSLIQSHPLRAISVSPQRCRRRRRLAEKYLKNTCEKKRTRRKPAKGYTLSAEINLKKKKKKKTTEFLIPTTPSRDCSRG